MLRLSHVALLLALSPVLLFNTPAFAQPAKPAGAKRIQAETKALQAAVDAFKAKNAALEKQGLVGSTPDPGDGRRRLLALTPAGHALVDRLTPLWAAFDAAATELDAAAGHAVAALDRLDDQLDRSSLFDRIMEKVVPSC